MVFGPTADQDLRKLGCRTLLFDRQDDRRNLAMENLASDWIPVKIDVLGRLSEYPIMRNPFWRVISPRRREFESSARRQPTVISNALDARKPLLLALNTFVEFAGRLELEYLAGY